MVKRWSLDDVKMVRLERRLHERLENKRKKICVLLGWYLERIGYTDGPRVALVNKITRRGRGGPWSKTWRPLKDGARKENGICVTRQYIFLKIFYVGT